VGAPRRPPANAARRSGVADRPHRRRDAGRPGVLRRGSTHRSRWRRHRDPRVACLVRGIDLLTPPAQAAIGGDDDRDSDARWRRVRGRDRDHDR
jgi:hypothetical protein